MHGVMVSAKSSEKAFQVRSLSGVIEFCPWVRHLTDSACGWGGGGEGGGGGVNLIIN